MLDKNHAQTSRAAQSAASAETDVSKSKTLYISTEQACEIAMIARWKVAEWRKMKGPDGNYRFRWFKLGKARNGRVRIEKASFLAFLKSMEAKPFNGKAAEDNDESER